MNSLIVITLFLFGSAYSLNILIFTAPTSGNLNPFLALGEKLVDRGHHVVVSTIGTACLDKGLSSVNMSQLLMDYNQFPTERGFNLETFSYVKKFLGTLGYSMFNTADNALSESDYDLIIGISMFFPGVSLSLAQKYNIKLIYFQPNAPTQWMLLPSYPHPSLFLNINPDDINQSFKSRFYSYVGNRAVFMVDIITGYYCGLSLNEMMIGPGIKYPLLISSVIGYEYPRTAYPLEHYVGPIIKKTTTDIPIDILTWLNSKEPDSVIFISMGSVFDLTNDEYEIIKNSILKTNYSAIWSLKKKDSKIQSNERILIKNWLPQSEILEHKSIKFAILHGGNGGISEALVNEKPMIIIPIGAEQHANAARVEYFKYGLHISRGELSVEKLIDSINTVTSFKNNLKRISHKFKLSGGGERSVDLIEYYSEFGYDHEVPVFAKYNWSFITNLNLDVLLFLSTITLLYIYITYKILSICLSICCCCCKKRNNKK
jgi:glucuronosyltransferase